MALDCLFQGEPVPSSGLCRGLYAHGTHKYIQAHLTKLLILFQIYYKENTPNIIKITVAHWVGVLLAGSQNKETG